MQTPNQNKSADSATTPTAKRPIWTKLLTVIVLLGVAVVFITLLPRGFSHDFTLIGKGENIVVMVHNPHLVDSGNNMGVISTTLRDEFKGRVTFLVADLFVQEGVEFIKKYEIDNATALVFFSPNGEKIKVLYGQQSAEAMRKNIAEGFHI